MIRITVVEDNADLLDDVIFNLEREGFDVAGVGNGVELDASLAGRGCDVLVLDLGLPGEDGLSIARRLRHKRPAMGILMLTARSGTEERIAGLEGGADVYLGKPVDMRELAAAIKSLARRLGLERNQGWRLNTRQLRLHGPAGEIALSGLECAILGTLADAEDHKASRRSLIEALGADYLAYDERRLETLISRLRRKLADCLATGAEAGSGGDNPLRALRGQGYIFAAPLQRV